MKRTEVVRARVSEVEYRVFEPIAQQEHRKQSELLRELIREGARRWGLWPLAESVQAQQQPVMHGAT